MTDFSALQTRVSEVLVWNDAAVVIGLKESESRGVGLLARGVKTQVVQLSVMHLSVHGVHFVRDVEGPEGLSRDLALK